MKYILFIKQECPYCVKAQELLESKNLNFSLVNFEMEQESVLSEIKKAYGWETVPMVFLKADHQIEFIGGCSDLETHLDRNG